VLLPKLADSGQATSGWEVKKAGIRLCQAFTIETTNCGHLIRSYQAAMIVLGVSLVFAFIPVLNYLRVRPLSTPFRPIDPAPNEMTANDQLPTFFTLFRSFEAVASPVPVALLCMMLAFARSDRDN
jgi:hypothetical protein